jgi:hypothetical protein
MRSQSVLMIVLGLTLAACAVTPETPVGPANTAPASLPSPTADSPTLGPPSGATSTSLPASPAPESTIAAPTEAPTAEPTPVLLTGAFVKGEVPVSGSYTLDVAQNLLTFSDDFKVVPGPDLVVILSGVGDVSLDFHTFSAQVLEAPFLRLGPLASTLGAQTYTIPAGAGLAVYQSVVIWCDSFSVEFAAAPLRP